MKQYGSRATAWFSINDVVNIFSPSDIDIDSVGLWGDLSIKYVADLTLSFDSCIQVRVDALPLFYALSNALLNLERTNEFRAEIGEGLWMDASIVRDVCTFKIVFAVGDTFDPLWTEEVGRKTLQLDETFLFLVEKTANLLECFNRIGVDTLAIMLRFPLRRLKGTGG